MATQAKQRPRAGQSRKRMHERVGRKPKAAAPAPPKLTVPRPAKLFPRERLFSLLDHTREDHRVIWVSAPGGAGKTSLATSYLNARKLPVLWYQVDSGDGDIASFFYYMGLAARRVAPRQKKPLPLLSPEYLADIPTFARNFFREFYRRMPRNGVFVLDNYQDAPEESRLHDVLHIAMSEVPEGINLIVLSRVEPPAVLARLRLCDHAACLDWGKMQLTPEETIGIGALRIGTKALDNAALRVLHDRAHGWAAGVVLMLEQGRGGKTFDAVNLPTGQKLLFDYFAGELLSRSDPHEQDFLIRTSLFPKISATAAAELTGNARAQAILDDLTRRNYFTVRHPGPGSDTYEYHPLFREFLLGQLERRCEAKAFRDICAHAAGLLETMGDVDVAVALWQKIGDWENAGKLIATNAPTYLGMGRAQLLLQWLGMIPSEVKDQLPWLLFWEGMSQLAFEPANARALLDKAYRRFRETRDAVGAYTTWCALIDTYIYEWSNFKPMLFWVEEFERLSVELPAPSNYQVETQVACAIFLGLLHLKPWRSDLLVWAEKVSDLVLQGSDEGLRAKMGPYLLIYFTWWRMDLYRCESLLDTLRPLMERRESDPLTQTTWHTMLAAYYWMTGENERCLITVRLGFEIADRSGVHVWDVLMACQGIFGALSSGKLQAADSFFKIIESRLSANRLMDHAMYMYLSAWRSMLMDDLSNAEVRIRRGNVLVEEAGWFFGATVYRNDLGRVLFYKGDWQTAIAQVQQARAEARSMGSRSIAYVTALVDAECTYISGDENACLRSMREFLSLGREHGLYNHTWWDARIMSRLYAKALAHDIETDYVRATIKKRGLSPPENETILESWPFPLKLYTLGRFSALVDDKPLKFSAKTQKKPLELLKALIAFGGREVSEAKLAEALWPDADGDAAAQALATTLHRLRKLIGKAAVECREGRLSLDTRHVWVDAWAFERSLSELEQACEKSDVEKLQALATRLFTLYRGPFLKDEADVPWVLNPRERLRARFLRHLESAARCLGESNRHDHAVGCYEKGLEVEPLAEGIHRGLIQSLLALDRRAEAWAAYQRCRRILASELGISPSPPTEALVREIRPA